MAKFRKFTVEYTAFDYRERGALSIRARDEERAHEIACDRLQEWDHIEIENIAEC